MTGLNKQELRRLAEAFPDDLDWDSNTEPFFNGPSGESLGGGSTGFYCVYGKPFTIDDEEYDGPTYVERCGVDFAKFMVEARDGVLALIAECEQLKSENERQAAEFKEWQASHHENYANAAQERDELRVEVESLRQDAERYRALREMNWCDGPLAVVADPYSRIKLGSDCPSRERLDEAVDSIMAKAAIADAGVVDYD